MVTKAPKKATKKVTKKTAKKAAPKKAAKKVVKKAAPKKPAVKKVVANNAKTRKKTTGPKMKVPVAKVISPDEYFWINYGPVVSDLQELAQALNDISDDQYYHHTRREEGVNDFARWIDEVFGDASLASRVARAKSRSGARRVIVSYVSM